MVSLILPLAGVPDLTDRQRAQLASAVDHDDRFDTPAIVPLLRHAATWPTPLDARGATIPDYTGILQDPPDHRGQLFLVEGRLARVVETAPLARAGPWDGRIREWDVLSENAGTRTTAVLFLVDPGEPPRIGSRVAVVARFYKVMRRRDVQHGAATDFPVFVGHSAHDIGPGSPSPPSPPAALLVVVLLLLVGYVLVRRMRKGPQRGAIRTGRDRGKGDGVEPVEASAETLPDDSIEALHALRQRAGRDERQDDTDGGSAGRTR